MSSNKDKDAKTADQDEFNKFTEISFGEKFPNKDEVKVLAEAGGDPCWCIINDRLLMRSISTLTERIRP